MSQPFIDSNIILYLLSADTIKADKAEAILEAGGLISVQVLNEVVAVCQRKLKMSWDEIDALIQAVKACVNVMSLTEESHALAVQLCKRYQLSFYDAHICASATLANAKMLLSEDMQHEMMIDDLKVLNPFI